MSAAGKSIRVIVDTYVEPLLRSDGFVRAGKTFYRRLNGLVHLFDVQSSPGGGTFTVNLSVNAPALNKILGKRASGDQPKEYDCTVRCRIGMLMPEKTDYWWTPTTDSSAVGKELSGVWTTYGKPWLDAMTSDEAVIDALIGRRMYFEAAKIFLHQGDRKAATGMIQKFLLEMRNTSPNYSFLARRWAFENRLLGDK